MTLDAAQIAKWVAHYDLNTDCDCDDEDCVRCSHHPHFQMEAAQAMRAAAPDLARTALDAIAAREAAERERDETIKHLKDPIAVHANMLRGVIAKPTLAQIIHLYGVDTLCDALAPIIVREANNEPS